MGATQNTPPTVVGGGNLVPKFKLTRQRLWSIVGIIVLIGLALLIKSFAAENLQIVSSIEGEQLPVTAGRVVSLNGASNGAAMGMLWTGSATWNVTPPSNANRIIVRAEGTDCNGPANMVVRVNGVTASSSNVTTLWADYTASVALPANKAVQIQVSFTNDNYLAGKCDRNLYIDKVELAYASQLDKVATVEAEQMAMSAVTGKNVAYNGASGGQAVELLSNGSLTAVTTPAADVTQLQITALGNSCSGSPTMTVSLNGKTVMTADVSSTVWQTYTVNTNLPKGVQATLKISYGNDYYNPPTCDRNLWIDKTDLWGPIITSPTPVPQGNIKLSIDSSNKTQVDISNIPANTNHLHFAVLTSMTANTGDSTQIHYIDLPATTTTYVPPAGFPVVDVAAMSDAANTQTIGTWAGRVQTLPGGSTPAPTPAPTPTPTPTPNSGFVVGVDAGNYGSGGANDVKGTVGYARMDDGLGAGAVSNYRNAGLLIDINFSGPYSGSGVSGLNATTWANNALSFYRSAGCTPASCPMIEVLNEPGGTWFWGSNALSATNASAYQNLIRTAFNTFHNAYGASAPKVLATFDGSNADAFGKGWWNSGMAPYVDGIIVHPYGGTGNRTTSAQGNRAMVTEAHTYTGKPIYVTEVGWPTAVSQPSTGDSLQWSEADQANNLFNFISWARNTGYVNAVMYFNYHDYGTNNWYGIVRSDGSHKPAYNALRCAAQNKPQNC